MSPRTLNGNFQAFTITGTVTVVSPSQGTFDMRLLTGDTITVRVSPTTWYEVMRNVGEEPQDRVDNPADAVVQAALGARPSTESKAKAVWDACQQMMKYISPERMVCVQGVESTYGNAQDFEARHIMLMHSKAGSFGWEVNQWWPHQINTLLEQWLDVLFQNRREITENDFAQFYRTNLDLLGNATSDVTQECATLSRFLYGLSSSYLLTGNPRALSAARACAAYLINAYSDLRQGNTYCLWKFGRVKDGNSTRQIFSSKNGDDLGTYALYEQIYALSGLAQFYRATQDVWVLSYIARTVQTFQALFLDEQTVTIDGIEVELHSPDDPCFTGKGGYFSHIDYVTLRPDSPALDATGNRMKKNWNSVGDHIPAYLVNVLLALDPLPQAGSCLSSLKQTLELCRNILENCVRDILDYFRRDTNCPYVQERFHADWSDDSTWGWQQDRAIVGHNLKISWNLTRCAHYFEYLAKEKAEAGDTAAEQSLRELTARCFSFAKELGKSMIHHGVDLVRGGIFDAVERHPQNGMPIQFAWESTKDFWQQEQAILAYYIMHGIQPPAKDDPDPAFLDLARACSAFWNLFFIDQNNRKVFFRTNEAGMPVISGGYAIQAGHAIAGYHAFELCYLAHVYIRAYVTGPVDKNEVFSLNFYPNRACGINSLNVLPDFLPHDSVEVASVRVNGVTQPSFSIHKFQLDITGYEPESVIEVEFRCRAGIVASKAEAEHSLGSPAAGMRPGLKMEALVDLDVLRKVGPPGQMRKESRSKAEQKTARKLRIEFGQEALQQSPAQRRASTTPPRPL